MAPKISVLGLGALLAGLVAAQKPGTTAEVHPALKTFRCTKAGGCVEKQNYLVLDSLAHPIHQATNSYGCGDWGNGPNATACPTEEACAQNCIMEGIPDYTKNGVFTDGASMTLKQLLNGSLVSPRVYLLSEDEQTYEMTYLTGQEFTFDVDTSTLPCGMNGALYLSEMEADGAKSELNTGGAFYGTGYCDAQCFVTPFINGVGNVGKKGSCCNEMDIWEANSRSTHIAPHPCNETGLYLCTGEECGQTGVCDKSGCGWNPRRVNQNDYYGRGADEFKVDTTRPFTVITRFPKGADGKLFSIERLYVQDDVLIRSEVVNNTAIPQVNAMENEYCEATGAKEFMRLGAMEGMGDAMTRGMVLAMSIWWDEGGNMTWLDSGVAGPCSSTEGNPRNIRLVESDPTVTYSNIRWGEIGSTYVEKGCSARKH